MGCAEDSRIVVGTLVLARTAQTDISGVSTNLETSLVSLGVALQTSVAPFTTTRDTEVASMKAEGSGISPMLAEESGLAAILGSPNSC